VTLNERLESIFRDVLDSPDLELRDEMNASDIPGWDSIAHINTMFSIEEEFGVRFAGDEFIRLDTIGQLKQVLSVKGAS
jgi:acyl carrier protein